RRTPEEGAQHDRLRRDRDPRVPLRAVQVLDRLATSGADAVHLHEAIVMRVRYEGGILVQEALKEVILDPARKTPGSVVSHGHMDHLTSGGIMTPQTVAVLKVRRGGTGQPLPYGKEIDLNGFRVVLKDAGHVFGSAMVRVDDLLYTGDFNPEGGATCGRAQPEFVRDHIVSWLGSIGLKVAYVSGWCAFFDYTHRYGLDAQFPLSDHGDFEDVMTFIEACRPRKVYTAFSGAKDLAKAVERRLKIRSEALLTR